jgi:hypothetical protein
MIKIRSTAHRNRVHVCLVKCSDSHEMPCNVVRQPPPPSVILAGSPPPVILSRSEESVPPHQLRPNAGNRILHCRVPSGRRMTEEGVAASLPYSLRSNVGDVILTLYASRCTERPGDTPVRGWLIARIIAATFARAFVGRPSPSAGGFGIRDGHNTDIRTA